MNRLLLFGLSFALAALAALPATGPLAPAASPASLDGEALPAFVVRGLDWLAAAQFENGGWGAGTHAQQDVRDPRAVQIDPATTAFSAMALLRSGSTLTDGPYHDNIRRALGYLLDRVEAAPSGAVAFTDVTGTQPQAKLGQNIDVSMTAQFFTQVLPLTVGEPALRGRVGEAVERCVSMLTRAQDADGSWNSRGGWAGVLQSSMANSALEMADEAGLRMDRDALDRSRQYQKNNLADDGAVRTEAAAGISLYSIASSQRATAAEARRAEKAVTDAVADGRLAAPIPPAEVSAETLREIGVADEEAEDLAEAYRKNRAATEMLQDEAVLSGFGNNGGEEFLSYMMTSEALAAEGGEAWDDWRGKMHTRLEKIQNNDGSWSGHHCITSPVFCTAAVILAMTADRVPG